MVFFCEILLAVLRMRMVGRSRDHLPPSRGEKGDDLTIGVFDFVGLLWILEISSRVVQAPLLRARCSYSGEAPWVSTRPFRQFVWRSDDCGLA